MLISQMTWEEFEKKVKGSVIYFPVGALEQHGPHLPLGVDSFLSLKMADLASDLSNGLVLPVVPYGYKSQPTSGGGQHFPGTTSFNGNTLISVIMDVLDEMYRHGARKYVMFNGHYENVMFITEAVDLFIKKAKDARVMLLDWTALIPQKIVDELFADCGFPGWDFEHAAVIETSLMQYFAPDQVREDKIIDDQFVSRPLYAMFPPKTKLIPKSGVLYKATAGTKEKGKLLIDSIIPEIAKVVNKEFE